MYENLTDEQLEKLLIIAQMMEKSQGDKNTINALNEYALSVLLPETNKMDELASLYELTGDESIKNELLNEYYSSKGISPEQRTVNNAYLEKFAKEFSTEDDKYGAENAQLQALAQQYPEILSQYYQGTPEPEEFNWGKVAAGAGTGLGAGAGVGKFFGPGILPAMGIGGALGGLVGLGSSLFDKYSESEEEKRARLNKLVNQYKANIPSN